MRNLALIRLRIRCRRTSRSVQKIVDFVRPYQTQINSLLILGSILGIGCWGHLNHWEFGGHHDEHGVAIGTPHGDAEVDPSGDAERAEEVETAKHSLASEHGSVQTPEQDEEPPSFIEAHATLVHDPNYVADLSSRVSGVVNRVFRNVGDRVHKGDLLVLIEAPIVGEAKASLLKALVQHDLKHRTLTRLRELGTVVSAKKIQEAETESGEAKIRLFNAQQALITLGLPVDIEDFSGKQDTDLAAEILALGVPDSVRVEYQDGALSANLVPIVAPFDGEVIHSKVVVGEYVNASQPEMTIADRKHFWISLNVHRDDSDKVFLGQKLTFQADCSDVRLSGMVDWISTEVDESTRTMCARAELIVESEDLARQIRSNVLGTCRLDLTHREKIAVQPGTEIKR